MPHWWRSYVLLLRWSLLQRRTAIPAFLIIQVGMAAGIVLGFSFLVPQPDPTTTLYLTTGSMTYALVIVGMVVAPQTVVHQKVAGILDYQRAMPVPRLALLAADATVWVAVALPGLAVTAVIAHLRFGLTFTISPLIAPAILLVTISSVAIGYGLAHAAPPNTTNLIAQLVVIFALMFSPINFPAERMPDWLASTQKLLPFTYMAQVVRETFSVPATGVPVVPFVILGAWCVAGLAITSWVMSRRT